MAAVKCSTKTCKRIALPRRKQCEHCATRGRNRARNIVASGLCRRCAKRPAISGVQCCAVCSVRAREYMRRWRQEVTESRKHRNIVYAHYGAKCACCGETNEGFLTIDHINGRKAVPEGNNSGLKQYIYLASRIQEGNPRTDIRILCYNCNCGRARNGGVCPHEELTNVS